MEDEHVSFKRRGISRLLEAILASVLLASSLSISYYYLIPANPNIVRGNDDLTKLGYDMLETLSRQGGFDRAIVLPNGSAVLGWERSIGVAMQTLLPPGIIFNLTVYRMVNYTGSETVNGTVFQVLNLVTPQLLNKANVTNAQPTSFLNAGETAEITFMFTTSGFYILVFDLQLARSTRL
jgi:hypothetical protein